MTTAAAMLRKLEPIDPIQEIGEAITATAEEAKNLNRIQLYQKGTKADGTRLKPYKNKAYADKKYRLNPNPGYGIPDAYLTGEMQRELFVEVRGDAAVFDSTSDHATFMIERDGPAVFGLTDESKSEYRGVMMPVALRSIKLKTGLQ